MGMQTKILIGLLMVAASALTACNNKSNAGNPPAPICPMGQVATPAGCSAGGLTPPIGYIQPTNGLFQYYASKTDFITNQDTLNLDAGYRDFLRDAMGVCDRCSTTIGEGVQCESWLRGFNMMMVSLGANTNSVPQIAFYSTPVFNQSSYYFSWQFPKIEDFFISIFTGMPAPSCNPGQYSPYWASDAGFDANTNANGGFSMVINHGPFYSRWNLNKFQLVVPAGKIGDTSFAFELSTIDKKGTKSRLATGTLTRCQTPNCRMF